jgi:hypothetical protein
MLLSIRKTKLSGAPFFSFSTGSKLYMQKVQSCASSANLYLCDACHRIVREDIQTRVPCLGTRSTIHSIYSCFVDFFFSFPFLSSHTPG